MQCHKGDINRRKNNKQCSYVVSPNCTSYLLCPLFTQSANIILSVTLLTDSLFPNVTAKNPARYINQIFTDLFKKLTLMGEVNIEDLANLKVATTHGYRVNAIDILSENALIPFSGATDRAGLANEHYSNWFRYLTGGGVNDRICAATLADWPHRNVGVKVPGKHINSHY